jgi:hypothetical protein
VVILNNGYLGMVRQWQDLFHARRYSEVYLADSNPDFAKLAEAYGIKGLAGGPIRSQPDTIGRGGGLGIRRRPGAGGSSRSTTRKGSSP